MLEQISVNISVRQHVIFNNVGPANKTAEEALMFNRDTMVERVAVFAVVGIKAAWMTRVSESMSCSHSIIVTFAR